MDTVSNGGFLHFLQAEFFLLCRENSPATMAPAIMTSGKISMASMCMSYH